MPCHACGLGTIPPIRSSIFSPFRLLIPSSVSKVGRLLVTRSYCKTHKTKPERYELRKVKWKVLCKSIMKSMGKGKEDRWALYVIYSMPSFQPEGGMKICFFLYPSQLHLEKVYDSRQHSLRVLFISRFFIILILQIFKF